MWGGGKDWGGDPWHGAALVPLLGMAGGDIPSIPIPPSPSRALGLRRGQSRDGAPRCSPPAPCPGVPPCPMPPPALCHQLGPGQRGPMMGHSSPGPGRDLRGDLERVPAGAGDRLCLSSLAGTFPCSPQGNTEQQHRSQSAVTTDLKLKKYLFLPCFQ